MKTLLFMFLIVHSKNKERRQFPNQEMSNVYGKRIWLEISEKSNKREEELGEKAPFFSKQRDPINIDDFPTLAIKEQKEKQEKISDKEQEEKKTVYKRKYAEEKKKKGQIGRVLVLLFSKHFRLVRRTDRKSTRLNSSHAQ